MGVLLPQQGRFANLGKNTQNGIELAIAGQGSDNSVQLAVQNSGETVSEVVTATETLLANSLPTMVLGPLVSEQAGAVRDLVQAAQIGRAHV
jgi:ABC-type branched-subunit amino acid transport system substrate-binding protein